MALNTEYDIEKAFRAIEDELIASLGAPRKSRCRIAPTPADKLIKL